MGKHVFSASCSAPLRCQYTSFLPLHNYCWQAGHRILPLVEEGTKWSSFAARCHKNNLFPCFLERISQHATWAFKVNENGKKGCLASLTIADFCSIYHLDTVLLIHQPCSGSLHFWSFFYHLLCTTWCARPINGLLQPGSFPSANTQTYDCRTTGNPALQLRTSSLNKKVFLSEFSLLDTQWTAVPHAGNEKQHKKENPTYHSANSVASGRGKGMVRICCVHPAITEEREKRYKKRKEKKKKRKKKSHFGGAEKQLSDHRQWKKQHALLHTCMRTCTHMHAGSPSSKRSYGHAAMHRMRWARERPARRNVAEAMSSTCRKSSAPLKWQLVHPLPRVMRFGRRVTAGASATGMVTAAKWKAVRDSPEWEGSINFNGLACARIKTRSHCTGDEKS